jgi:hypothetical protein
MNRANLLRITLPVTSSLAFEVFLEECGTSYAHRQKYAGHPFNLAEEIHYLQIPCVKLYTSRFRMLIVST